MLHGHRLVLTAAALGAASLNAQVAPATKTPDQQWTDLSKPTVTAPSKVRADREATVDALKEKVAQQANEFLQKAQAARNFHEQFPLHAKAAEARKVEAIYSLRAIKDGDNGQERNALGLAATVRENRSLPIADRFEVALAVERYQQSRKNNNKTATNSVAEWVAVADKLKREFGDLPALQEYYLELARRADLATANTLTAGILQSTVSSPVARAEAQSIKDRWALIGRPLPLKLAKFGGGEVDLGQPQNRVVALIVWSPLDPDSLGTLKEMRQSIPDSVQVVYMGIGGDLRQLANVQPLMPIPGAYCYAATPTTSKAFGNALKLKYAPTPAVYVLDRTGKVSGFGRVKDLPALLVKAVK